MLLVLFDVDGTLLLSHDPLVEEATREAVGAVYGLHLADDAMAGIAHEGRTARWITTAMLRKAGLGEEAIAAGLDAWCEAVSERYLQLLAAADTSRWESPPGTAEALAAIGGFARIALLTGNPEPIARARMDRLGLAGFFPQDQGAFGCEGDERADLIAIARTRAGGWPEAGTVEVGDTPSDVSGTHAARARSIAVLWGRFTRADLAGADAYVARMAELPAAVRRLDSGA